MKKLRTALSIVALLLSILCLVFGVVWYITSERIYLVFFIFISLSMALTNGIITFVTLKGRGKME